MPALMPPPGAPAVRPPMPPPAAVRPPMPALMPPMPHPTAMQATALPMLQWQTAVQPYIPGPAAAHLMAAPIVDPALMAALGLPPLAALQPPAAVGPALPPMSFATQQAVAAVAAASNPAGMGAMGGMPVQLASVTSSGVPTRPPLPPAARAPTNRQLDLNTL
jgi:hypothetical protein